MATGNDPTTGALSAMGAEASAKAVSHYVFGTDKPSDLTAEQKQTVSSIVSLAGIGVGATTGDVGSAVSAGEAGKVAVEDNDTFNLSSTDFGMSSSDVSYATYCASNPTGASCTKPNVVNSISVQIDKILENKPFGLLYKVAANGDSIVCIPVGAYTCGLRTGEHFASPEEVRKGNSEFLMSVVPVPGGKGAKVVAKKTGQVIGIYEDAKVANAAIQRARVEANIATSKAARESSGYAPFSQKATNISSLTNISIKQLDKKFKYAEDFGIITTKKNSQTLNEFGNAIKTHMRDSNTIQNGTYGFVADSKVFYNTVSHNVVVVDKGGNFVTGFRLTPGTAQYENFFKNGVLR